LSFTSTSYSIVQGQSVTFNANVRNVGTYDVTDGEVEVELGGNDLGVYSVDGLAVSSNTAVVQAYTAAGDMVPGNYTVRAWIDADNECDDSNNEATFTLEVTQGVCGDGIANNGEACDGGSNCNADCTVRHTGGGGGGSSSDTVDVSLTDFLPSATTSVARYDVIRLQYNGKAYSFRFKSIFTDTVKVDLISPPKSSSLHIGEFDTYDLDRDGEDDVRLTILDIQNRRADVKFELLNVAASTGQPVKVLDFPAPKTKDRTVISAPVASTSDSGPKQESLLRGFITFVENFAAKRTVPVWAGALLAVLIAVIGAGLFYVLTRKN